MKPVIIIAIAFVLLITIPVFADTHTIETANDSGLNLECGTQCYTPNTLTVDVGHIVTMTNTDETGIHTFTSGNVYGFAAIPDGEFDSGMLNFGESFEFISNIPDVYPYYCSLHVWMQGVFIVQEAEAEEVIVNPIDSITDSYGSESIADVSSNNKIIWVLVIISFIIMGFAIFKKKTQNQKVEKK